MDGRSRLLAGPGWRLHHRGVPVVEEARWLEESVGVRVLDDRTVVSIRGDDARSWLNGQLTNDLRALSGEATVYGVFLSPKGRILADATVHERAGELFVDVPTSAWPTLRAHLEKYVIMEDVTLAEEPLCVVTAQGPRAGEILPDAPHSDRLRRGGRDLLCGLAGREAVVETLGAKAASRDGGVVSDAGWELARIRAGVPRHGRDFDEHVYPHEAGLEKTAVSFQKGCYLGQEVVCMLESRGQISRRLARLEADGALAPGAVLRSAAGEVGHVSSAVVDGAATRGLGLVKRTALGEPTLTGEGGTVRNLGPT